MYLWFRFIFTVARAFFRGWLYPSDKSITKLIVFPNDVDIYRVSNGRYPSFMDLGRIDLLIRYGFFFKAIKGGYFPVVGSEYLRFKKSLKLFQIFEVHSQLRHCGEKWAYLEHRIYRKDELIAIGYVKGLFHGPSGILPATEMFRLLGNDISKLPFDETVVAKFEDMEKAVFQEREITTPAPSWPSTAGNRPSGVSAGQRK